MRALACSPDAAVVASQADDRTVRLWDVEGTDERALFSTGYGRWDDVFRFSPDGTNLWATSGSQARAWRLFDGAEVALPCALPEGVRLWRGLARGGAAFVDDGVVTIAWEIGTGRPQLCRLRASSGFEPELVALDVDKRDYPATGKTDVAFFSDDGAWLATNDIRWLTVYDARDGRRVGVVDEGRDDVTFGGSRWLLTHDRETVSVRSLPDLAPRGRISLASAADQPTAIEASPDGAPLFVGTQRGAVLRFSRSST